MIPEAYERRCIGRQIRRKLRSGAQETGRITGENRRDLPIIYYNVEWQTANQPIVEIMALSTLQTWFSEEDSYVDEAWVDEELRILQKVDWNERKKPQKDSKEWRALLNQLAVSPQKGDKQAGRGRRSAPAKNGVADKAPKAKAAQEALQPTAANPSNTASKGNMASPNAEAAPVAPMSPGGMAALKSKARGVAGAVYSTANAAADAIREAPQVLGNKISDALPGSSKRQASSRQAAASTAETATASKAHSTRDNGSDMSDAIGSKAAKDVTSESTPNAAEQQVIDVLGRITRGSVTGSKGKKRPAPARTSHAVEPAASAEPAVTRMSPRKAAKAVPSAPEEDMEIDLDGANEGADEAGQGNGLSPSTRKALSGIRKMAQGKSGLATPTSAEQFERRQTYNKYQIGSVGIGKSVHNFSIQSAASVERTAKGGSDGDAASPSQQPSEPPEKEGEEMLQLPQGANPSQIPKSLALQDGDRRVQEYRGASFGPGEEFVVDTIVAERKRLGWEYLVKWKGFELDLEEWNPEANLADAKALDLWEQQQGRKRPAKKTSRKKARRG